MDGSSEISMILRVPGIIGIGAVREERADSGNFYRPSIAARGPLDELQGSTAASYRWITGIALVTLLYRNGELREAARDWEWTAAR